MQEYSILWWNVENLFDVEKSPNRTEKLQRTLQKELTGWTEDILEKKISQLSQIISKTHNNMGPDIMGICEVENRIVVDKLKRKLNDSIPHHNYEIVHADTNDKRGIDIAFLYDINKFEVEKDQNNNDLVFSHFVVKSEATRDILQANFLTKNSEKKKRLVLVGNHWPSRSGGQYESEPYRIVAGETLSYFHKRILEETIEDNMNNNNNNNNNNDDDDTATSILVMGDFNDEPFDRSIVKHALALSHPLKISFSKNKPWLYNLMYPLVGEGIGTFYFNNFPNLLDQFMVSKGIVSEKEFKVDKDSVYILKFPEMSQGRYKTPIKFGRPSNTSLNLNGYSDHFPISMMLQET
jgi:hypothetical protein